MKQNNFDQNKKPVFLSDDSRLIKICNSSRVQPRASENIKNNFLSTTSCWKNL